MVRNPYKLQRDNRGYAQCPFCRRYFSELVIGKHKEKCEQRVAEAK